MTSPHSLATERYAATDWPQVSALLGNWPYKPLAWYARRPTPGLEGLCLARVTSVLQNPKVTAWVVRSKVALEGFAAIRLLPWDSEHIGLSAGRLDYLVAAGTYNEQYQAKRALLEMGLQHCMDKGIQYTSARLDASDLSGLHALEQEGFVLVDGILTFACSTDGGSPAPFPDNVRVRLATPADSETAAALASQVYRYDRFHSDPVISNERADELHAEWLRRSCTGEAADAVILAEDDQGVIGFVTCKLQRDTKMHLGKSVGTIVLVATAQRARRMGVARATTWAAIKWFREEGVDLVDVGTQLRNIPAARFYESCGFKLVGSSVSLRKLL